jgi:hypothetical protein
MSTGSMKGRVDPQTPKEIRERVENWMDRVKEPRTPEAFFRDPDWPVAVQWARQHRERSTGGRKVQKQIVRLHRLQTAGRSYAMYTVLRRALRARLQRLLGTERGASVIAKAPCGPLLRVGRFLLSHANYQRYVESHVADIHHEYFAALAAGEPRRAKWIVVRGYLSVLSPLWAGFVSTLKALWKISGA